MEQIIQRSPEWYAARCGLITSSAIKNITMKDSTAGYRNYLAQLVAERMTGTVDETYKSYDMQIGTEREPAARLCYQFITGVSVQEVGFIKHETLNTGSSPDGLVESIGQVEIKCPKVATHIDYLKKGVVPTDYRPQMHHQMLCSGRMWNDFVSYCPELDEELQLFICRLYRDEEVLTDQQMAIVKFDAEINDLIETLEVIKKRRLWYVQN